MLLVDLFICVTQCFNKNVWRVSNIVSANSKQVKKGQSFEIVSKSFKEQVCAGSLQLALGLFGRV